MGLGNWFRRRQPPRAQLLSAHDALAAAGIRDSEVPSIAKAIEFSEGRIQRARRDLVSLRLPNGVSLAAAGSYGRLEASDASDFDLAFLHETPLEKPTDAWDIAVKKIRDDFGYPVKEGLFSKPVDVRELIAHIGGDQDTNSNLTFRALILTEGAWIFGSKDFSTSRERILSEYREGSATRGKFLTSLSNDLHRYYRTLCVDYREKVEVAGKGWALRNFKLRHSRKVWHLANVLTYASAVLVDDDERDGFLSARLAGPSLAKILTALDDFKGLKAGAHLIRDYEFFLSRIERPDVRTELEELEHGKREASRVFLELRENAKRLDRTTQDIIGIVMKVEAARAHLIRFWML